MVCLLFVCLSLSLLSPKISFVLASAVRSDIFAINMCISAQMNVSTHTHEYALYISHSRIHCGYVLCVPAVFNAVVHSTATSIPECFFSSLQLIHTTHLRTSAEGKKPSHFEPTLMCIAAFGIYSVYVCVCASVLSVLGELVRRVHVQINRVFVNLLNSWQSERKEHADVNIWAPKCKRTSTHINGWVDRWMDECVHSTCAFCHTTV